MKTTAKLRSSALLIAGLSAGAMLSPIGFAGAQDDPATPEATSPGVDDATSARTAASARDGDRRGGQRQLGDVLETLGLDADTVRSGLADDLTLVEIAEANGVSASDLVAAIEADIIERVAAAVVDGRVTQAEADEKLADLTAEVTDRVNTPRSERTARGEGEGRRGRGRGAKGAAVLEELGLSMAEVRQGRAAGQTLAETAEANGIGEAELVSALVAEATERAESAVESGRLDADEAAERIDGLAERIADRVNATPPG